MCETQSPWSMKDYRMELLRQDNSALAAKVAAQEKELSLLRERVLSLSSIATVLLADLRVVRDHLHTTYQELLSPPYVGSSAGTTLLRVEHSLKMLGSVLYMTTVLTRALPPVGVSAGTKKKRGWFSRFTIFKGKPTGVC